jgi:HSP20 family protein
MTKKNSVQLTNRGSMALVKSDAGAGQVFIPSTDVLETRDAFVVKLDLPGATRETMQISIEGGELTVRAPVERGPEEGTIFLQREIGRKTYLRVFRLTEGIDDRNIDAVFEDGVLTITLPKREELKSRSITIT